MKGLLYRNLCDLDVDIKILIELKAHKELSDIDRSQLS